MKGASTLVRLYYRNARRVGELDSALLLRSGKPTGSPRNKAVLHTHILARTKYRIAIGPLTNNYYERTLLD